MTQTLVPAGLAIRTLTDDELRPAYELFRASVNNGGRVSDEHWQVMARAYDATRSFGAFDGSRLVGTACSFPASLTVPGGNNLPMAAVTYVGVRADQRRRGALTGMMRSQLAAVAAAGEVFAGLHASEPVIYGRFGYGIASMARTIRVDPRRSALRPEVPVAGTVRLLDPDEALTLLPAAYRPARVGTMGRSQHWWTIAYERRLKADELIVAAHLDPDGAVDGWVAYRALETGSDDPRAGDALRVLDFYAADQRVTSDLWRFLLGVDLVDEVTVYQRPLDDPIEVMLVNSYAVRGDNDDDLWLRIVDVPAALAGRTYGAADPVVVEVVDRMLPANSGCYLVGPRGAERTSAAPALTVDAEVLAMLYLGTWRPSTLADLGRIDVADPTALPAADLLFATDRPAWCGSMF